MKCYYDTGVILKLYADEPDSDAARAFVIRRKEALYLSSLHVAELTSAMRLKQFRGECEAGQVAKALTHLDEDFRAGVLKALPVEWDNAWKRCRALSDAHAATSGCRTLDAVHVACAILAPAAEFITSDRRQRQLGKLAGLRVINPFE
jgi:predicted nucleic acid-binding protein